MEGSIGIVIPAYEPDVPALVSYVDDIRTAIPVETVRVELDMEKQQTIHHEFSALDAEINVVGTRRGKGAAITRGFDSLNTDILAFADADGSTPVGSLVDVVWGVSEADLSVGSRRHPEAEIVGSQDPLRQYMGDVFARAVRTVLAVDLYDFQCGAKALTSDAWEMLRSDITETGFAWDLEVIGMAHAHGFDIAEVPVEWEDKPGSTVDPIATTFDLARALVAINHRMQLHDDSQLHQIMSSIRRLSTVDQ